MSTDSQQPQRVLVVDDEVAVRRFLRNLLEGAGFAIFEAGSGEEALEMMRRKQPSAVLLDLRLPDISGVEVLRVLREWSKAPVLMLSVQNEEADIVSALDAGADDYLSKPFGTAELLARLRSALRRSGREAVSESFESAELHVNLETRTVTVAGETVGLTPTEYDLLKVFVHNAGRVLTHVHLLRAVWGNGYAEDIGVLRVNISNLRKKLEQRSGGRRLLLTEPGVGYRLLAEAP
jgi:two-component system KDP operon response regulator KdpE